MKDILFVDDDRDLLESLRARLYKHRHEWNMKFVVSGDEAIAALCTYLRASWGNQAGPVDAAAVAKQH